MHLTGETHVHNQSQPIFSLKRTNLTYLKLLKGSVHDANLSPTTYTTYFALVLVVKTFRVTEQKVHTKMSLLKKK